MDVHHTFVFVNQEFNYSSLLETGIFNRRHFKNSLQLRNLPECLETRYARRRNIRFQTLKTALFSLLMAEKNSVGQTFFNKLRMRNFLKKVRAVLISTSMVTPYVFPNFNGLCVRKQKLLITYFVFTVLREVLERVSMFANIQLSSA
jgi:hypothetical protein